jgi:hypothetical protein
MLALLSAAGLGAACSGSSTIDNIDASAVRAYADNATELMLQGISQNDIAKYCQYCDAAMKAAVTKEVMDKTSSAVTNQYGMYLSKQFLSIEQKAPYVIVHYKATFTKGQLGIRMVFDKDHLIAGQWFE